jgi:hypothetical protein
MAAASSPAFFGLDDTQMQPQQNSAAAPAAGGAPPKKKKRNQPGNPCKSCFISLLYLASSSSLINNR